MNRRDFLIAARAVGVLAATGASWPRSTTASPGCALSPQQTAGPFYFDPGLFRRDITEAFDGMPMRLSLRLVEASSCAPITNALLDVWHTEHRGWYSGYPGQGDDGSIDTQGETFMRGIQVTDADGRVEFDTVYPGWYPGRVAHVHFKAHFDDRTLVTSQLYFPDEVSERIYASGPYAARGQNPTTLASDLLLRNTDLDSVLLGVDESGPELVAERTLAVDLPSFTPTPTNTVGPPQPTATPAGPTDGCNGDCSGDGVVSVDELVRGVNISLGRTPIEDCAAFDGDGNRRVTVSELVAAVNSALRGCS